MFHLTNFYIPISIPRPQGPSSLGTREFIYRGPRDRKQADGITQHVIIFKILVTLFRTDRLLWRWSLGQVQICLYAINERRPSGLISDSQIIWWPYPTWPTLASNSPTGAGNWDLRCLWTQVLRIKKKFCPTDTTAQKRPRLACVWPNKTSTSRKCRCK